MTTYEKIQTDVIPVVPLPDESDTPKQPYLIILTGPETGQVHPITDGMVLGQRFSADIGFSDTSISQRHCRITVLPNDDVVIEDLESKNGTFVAGEQISVPRRLEDGNHIQVGLTTIMKFTLQDDLESELQQRLYEDALRDGLTQIYNRRYLLDRCKREFAFAARHGSPLSLLMLDLDHFKRVNDQFGHPAGDFILRRFGQQLLAATREEDVCGRYGGEEFLVMIFGVPIRGALIMAERIRQLVAKASYDYQSTSIPLTVSIGIAGLPDHSITTPTSLIKCADEALYQAKRDGRNTSRIYVSGQIT